MNVSNQIICEENFVWFIVEIIDVYKYEIQWFWNGIMVMDVVMRYEMMLFVIINDIIINIFNIFRVYNCDEGNVIEVFYGVNKFFKV